jgi:Tfp pilus assembly protein PilE
MLVLGILAAIAIPSFFEQRDKLRDAEAKADVRAAQAAIEIYANDANGSYAGATPAALVGIEPALTDVNSRGDLAVSSSAGEYRIAVESVNAPNRFWISRDPSGSLTLGCDEDGNGGCPSDGTWD